MNSDGAFGVVFIEDVSCVFDYLVFVISCDGGALANE